MVGLALEGGGAKGSYQIGAYMALKKCHIKIEAVVGTSIGAFNGAMIAAHDEDKLLSLWKDTTMNELLGIDETKAMEVFKGNFNKDNVKWSITELHKILKNKGLDISNYRAVVRNNIDENKVRKSNIKFGLTTVKQDNFEPLEVYTDDIEDGKLADYIVASSFLPVFKKEKLVDNSYYLDGGFYNLSPTDMLEKIGCDEIYVINIRGIGIRKRNKKLNSRIIEIKPHNNLGSIIVFDKNSTLANITYGYNDTMKVFDKLDGNKYYFKKKSDRFYRKLNNRINTKLYNATKALVNANSEKETVIKAVEYILEKEKVSDLEIYNIKKIIKQCKKGKSDNIIYRYIRLLNTGLF